MVFVPQRIRILKFVAEQGVVTVDDVARHLQKSDQLPAIRTALHDCGLSHTKYGDIRQGIWFIENQKLLSQLKSYYFPYIPSFEAGRPRLFLVDHSLELNRIRITLQQTDQMLIEGWWSEAYIRALSFRLPGGGSIAKDKIPDAIMWRRRTDGSQQIFFIEYERSCKNKERYRTIFRYYASLPDVKNQNVIYLCQDPSLKKSLEELEIKFSQTGDLQGAGLFFQFISLDDFYQTYNNPKQEEGNGQQTQTLSQQAYA